MEINVQLIIKWIIMLISAIILIYGLAYLIDLILSLLDKHTHVLPSAILACALTIILSICGFLGAYKNHLLCLIICFVGMIVVIGLSGYARIYLASGIDVLYILFVGIYAFMVHQNGGTMSTTI